MSIEGIAAQNRVRTAFGGSSEQPVRHTGFRQPAFGSASSDSFASSASPNTRPQVTFGGAGFQGIKNAFQYLATPESRRILLGLFFETVVPAMLGLSFLGGPLGWALAVVGIPLTMASGWLGARILKNVDFSTPKRGDVLPRLKKLSDIWFDTTRENAHKFIFEWNQLMRDVTAVTSQNGGSKTQTMNQFRRAMSINPRNRMGRFVRHALEVKGAYASRWFAQPVKWLTGILRKVPPLRPVALGVSFAFNALFMLFNWRILSKAVKTVVK